MADTDLHPSEKQIMRRVFDAANEALQVNVVATVGGGGGGSVTEYTEDAASAANPTGAILIARRRDTPAGETTTDGDNVALNSTDKGELYVKHIDSVPVTATNLDIRDLTSASDSVAVHGDVGVLSQFDLTNSNPATVAIVDANGDQITSFGGGTQYTEGDTDASITGTAMLMEGAADTLLPVQGTVADGILVNLGSNNDVSVSNFPANAIDGNNSTSTPLAGAATFSGTSTDALAYTAVSVYVTSDVNSATNGLIVQKSTDGTNFETSHSITYLASQTIRQINVPLSARYIRVSYTNGATPQGYFRLSTKLIQTDTRTNIVDLAESFPTDKDALLTRSIITGETTAGGGSFVNVKVNPSGAVSAAVTQDTSPWVVSGTVDVNDITGTVSLPTGASTEAKQDTIIGHVDGIEGLLTTIDGDTGNLAATVSSGRLLTTNKPQNVSVTDTLTALNDTVEIDDAGFANFGINISGTWVGTIQFEASVDGTNWHTIYGVPDTGSIGSTTAANGSWHFAASAHSKFRVNAIVWTSGTANITIVGSPSTHLVEIISSSAVNCAVSATQQGTWNINDISGTISLPTGASTSANQTTIIGHVDGIETLLGTIDADTSTIAGAVSGTEMQVDVLTMPTTTVQATNLDIRDLTSASDSVAAVQSGSWTVSTTGTATTKETRSATGTTTSVAGSASSVTLLASNANRLGASIYNDSTAYLYIKCGATASTTSFITKLPQDATWEVPFHYTGIIDGIWASATGNARITEFT